MVTRLAILCTQNDLIVGEVYIFFIFILGKLQTLDVLLQRLKAGGHRYSAKFRPKARGLQRLRRSKSPELLHIKTPKPSYIWIADICSVDSVSYLVIAKMVSTQRNFHLWTSRATALYSFIPLSLSSSSPPFPYRILIFTQMARMLDVLEIFLNYHGHTYLRLDGATPVQKRQVFSSACTASSEQWVWVQHDADLTLCLR